MNKKKFLNMIISLFASCCDILVAISHFYWWSRNDPPSSGLMKLHFNAKFKDNYECHNFFTFWYEPIFFGFLATIFFIIEIFLAFLPQYTKDILSAPLFRGCASCFLGANTLGISGDLGFSAGILSIISGVFIIIVGFLNEL